MSEREPAGESFGVSGSQSPEWGQPEVLLLAPASDVEVALLDPDGRIVSVNDAWSRFCDENGGDAGSCGVGVSYLGVCDRAGDVMATLVGAAVRSALRGELPAPLAVEVPCHSSGTLRWFDVLVSSRLGDDGMCLGATVTLSLVRSVARPSGASPGAGGSPTGRQPDPAPGQAATAWLGAHPSAERLGDGVAHAVFAVAPCGVLLADDGGRVVAANVQADDLFGVDAGSLVGHLLERLLPSRWRDGPGASPTKSEGNWTDPAYSGRMAVGIRPDGTHVRVRLTSAPVPLSVGAGTLLTVSAVHERADRAAGGPGSLLVDLDAAMRRIFSAGLTLASVRERLDQDGVPARVIGEVMADLDRAAREVRRAGLPRRPTG